MVILTIYYKSSVSALGQPLRKRLPASDWADPQILRRSRGKRHHHGDDVCGGSCVCVDGTFRTIPTVGNLWSRSILLPPELFRTQIGVKLLIVSHLLHMAHHLILINTLCLSLTRSYCLFISAITHCCCRRCCRDTAVSVATNAAAT